MIGVVGGVGPYAGLDLMKNIFDQTKAANDQEHMDVLLLNMGSRIPDRTEYLLGQVDQNPAKAIAEVLVQLEEAGATVAGVACNTAHADEIMSETLEILSQKGSSIVVRNMIDETIKMIRGRFPKVRKVGVLSTTGTNKFRIYQTPLSEAGLEPVEIDMDMQEGIIHPAIYDPEYGIKAISNPVTDQAIDGLQAGLKTLKAQGAEVIIKGCTEIALAIPGSKFEDIQLIDPSIVLARSLIKFIDPAKLKPLNL